MTFNAPSQTSAVNDDEDDERDNDSNYEIITLTVPEAKSVETIRDEEFDKKWQNQLEHLDLENVDDDDDEELYLDYIKSCAAATPVVQPLESEIPKVIVEESERVKEASDNSKELEDEVKVPEEEAETPVNTRELEEVKVTDENKVLAEEVEPGGVMDDKVTEKECLNERGEGEEKKVEHVGDEEEDVEEETNGMMDRLLSAVSEGYYFWKV